MGPECTQCSIMREALCSLLAQEAIAALEAALKEKKVSAKMIYSGGEDLDVLPAQASKGKGLEFLLKEVRVLLYLTIS